MLDKVNKSIMERLVVQLEQQDRERAETVEPAMHGVESAMDDGREHQCSVTGTDQLETERRKTENEAPVEVHTTAADVNMEVCECEEKFSLEPTRRKHPSKT